MERLIIDIPDQKSTLVKQLLTELGVVIQSGNNSSNSNYRQQIAKVSTWTEEDIKAFEAGREAFNSLKPASW